MNKYWKVTKFDVGRELGNPDYIRKLEEELQALREAAEAVVKDAEPLAYRTQLEEDLVCVDRNLFDKLKEALRE